MEVVAATIAELVEMSGGAVGIACSARNIPPAQSVASRSEAWTVAIVQRWNPKSAADGIF